MAAPVPIPPDIQAIAGPSLLGYVFNWGLYGALSIQVYIYYMSFPKDRRFIKALVYGLYILETVQTILITHDLFHVYAFGWGNLEILGEIGFTWLSVPIFDGIVSFTVQMFFAYRITILSGSKLIGGIVSLVSIPVNGWLSSEYLTSGSGRAQISFTQFVAAIVAGAQAKIIGNFQKLQTEAFVSTAIWLTGSAVCDVVIAASMGYFLSKKDIAFKATQVMVDRMVRLTIETGTLTATIATVDVILFLSFRHANYHTAPAITLGKLYTNTLLLIFNSRIRIVGGRGASHSSEFMELSALSNNGPSSNSGNRNATNIRMNPSKDNTLAASINVSQSTWTDGSKPNIAKVQYFSEDGDHSTKVDEMGKRDQDWDSRV